MAFGEGAVYICEEVSSICRKGEIVYLTDVSGSITITRAMDYGTFKRCVRGAGKLLDEWEADRAASNVIEMPRRA